MSSVVRGSGPQRTPDIHTRCDGPLCGSLREFVLVVTRIAVPARGARQERLAASQGLCADFKGRALGWLGYVEVVLADHGIRGTGAADDQRIPRVMLKLSRGDDQHERRTGLRKRSIR
jgi:hypothetical protein